MDHKEILASLSSEQRRHLCAQSDGPGLLRIAVHFGLILLFGALIVVGGPWAWLFMPIQGVLLVFLFTALHETIHGTAFRTSWLNTWVANACSFLVILPSQEFRYFHFAHHRYTHDPDKDPELAGGKPDTRLKLLVYLTGLPEWYWRLKNIFKNAFLPISSDYVPTRGRARVALEARVFLALYAVLAGLSSAIGTTALLWAWILPLILGNPFLRAYLLAEHSFCPHVADMLQNTRKTFTNRLVRWIAWNMPYHIEHHAYPSVPFHKLPEFHDILRGHHGETENGYARFTHRYFEDPKTGRPLNAG
ncbi:MAG: fatty acid desaturase [Pseudomonadota bacterium]